MKFFRARNTIHTDEYSEGRLTSEKHLLKRHREKIIRARILKTNVENVQQHRKLRGVTFNVYAVPYNFECQKRQQKP